MNLYLRYFDREILVDNVDDAISFLCGIDEIDMNPVLENDIRNYVNSEVYYPKRYKVRPRVYFIIIKTEAATMQDFKEKRALHSGPANTERSISPMMAQLNEQQYGWYEGVLDFKRVQQIPATGKFQYKDTHFVAFHTQAQRFQSLEQYPCVEGTDGSTCVAQNDGTYAGNKGSRTSYIGKDGTMITGVGLGQ